MVGSRTDVKRKNLVCNRVRAKQMRRKPVALEKLFWSEVRNRKLGGFKFKRQFLIGNYIVDFACLERKVIVELDGPFHAHMPAYDAKRDTFLQSCGYRVLRFSNTYAANELAVVFSTVRHALSADSPSP